jgi:hypothetical protein
MIYAITNLCPSGMHSDHEIVAKAFAERMKMVLPNIIHKNQTGFLKDLYAGKNNTLFLGTQKYAKSKKQDMQVPSGKPYERMDGKLIMQSLSAFGFGPKL